MGLRDEKRMEKPKNTIKAIFRVANLRRKKQNKNKNIRYSGSR